MRAEPDALELPVVVARGRVTARALPGVLGPAARHLVLAGVAAERDAQVWIVSVLNRPEADLRGYRCVVLAVQVRIAELVRVGRVQEDCERAAPADVLA